MLIIIIFPPSSSFFLVQLFPPSLPYFSPAFTFYGEAPVTFPSFSNFAKVSSPFLQRAMYSFTESSRKSKGQEEEALPQEVDIGSLSFSYFPYFTYFSFVLSPF